MIDAKKLDTKLSVPPVDSPLDMLIRVFAVVDLLEKAQKDSSKQQGDTPEKTQNEEAIVS